MKTYTARPSAAHLRRLRLLLRDMQSRKRSDLGTAELTAFTRVIDPSHAFTIDFDAIEELGYPLVVMRDTQKRRVSKTLRAALSVREQQVLELVFLGLRNREIAERLGISVATVKDHMHHILEKSGFRSRVAMIAAASATR